jgi:hypothetical protein
VNGGHFSTVGGFKLAESGERVSVFRVGEWQRLCKVVATHSDPVRSETSQGAGSGTKGDGGGWTLSLLQCESSPLHSRYQGEVLWTERNTHSPCTVAFQNLTRVRPATRNSVEPREHGAVGRISPEALHKPHWGLGKPRGCSIPHSGSPPHGKHLHT